jgi:hypothetical protein
LLLSGAVPWLHPEPQLPTVATLDKSVQGITVVDVDAVLYIVVLVLTPVERIPVFPYQPIKFMGLDSPLHGDCAFATPIKAAKNIRIIKFLFISQSILITI